MAELLRVVVVGGALVPDPRRRLPGRGAYLHPDPACLDLAERRRAFPRALRLTGGGAGALDAGAVRAYVEAASDESRAKAEHSRDEGRSGPR